MSKRLLDTNGVTTDWWHYDEMTDTATIQTVTDAQPVIERNKRLRNDTDGYTPSRDLRHVATIDRVTYERWLREAFGANWNQRPSKDKMAVIKRKINDPDFRNFRTVDVRI